MSSVEIIGCSTLEDVNKIIKEKVNEQTRHVSTKPIEPYDEMGRTVRYLLEFETQSPGHLITYSRGKGKRR